MRHVVAGGCDGLQDLIVAVALERWATRQQYEHDDATAPHVTHRRVAAFEHFRSNIVWRAIGFLHLGPWLKSLRRTEVDDLNERFDCARTFQ